jgi:hypothetical protein
MELDVRLERTRGGRSGRWERCGKETTYPRLDLLKEG